MEDAAPQPTSQSTSETPPAKSAAGVVAGGILSSRLLGFVRTAVEAHFFGVSAFADVLRTALRMPNVLQNLLGEGTVSAAFIPIYSRMLDEGREEDAGRFAGAILGLMIAVVAALVLFGIALAPYLVALSTPGYMQDATGELAPGIAWAAEALARAGAWFGGIARDLGLPVGEGGAAAEASDVNRYGLTVQAVRIIFPMTGILVLFAWALGVLNSHRRFFLSYFAPVLWNVAIIAALFGTGYVLLDDPLQFEQARVADTTMTRLLFAAFIGALVGGVLQFLVPLPLAFKLLKGFRLSVSRDVPGVREALRAVGPVVAGRGVYQLSTYLDLILASFLAAGAVSALGYAQMLYVLPVSLFGMSVAASELPELSRLKGREMHVFMGRMGRSLRQMMFLTLPTAFGYLAFGFVLIGAILQRGSFGLNDTWLVYSVLGAYTLGLPATTISRLLQNAFYALNDTKTPAKIAVTRVVVSTVVAIPLMFVLDRYNVTETLGLVGEAPDDLLFFGAVGLAVGASVGAWTELWRLMHALRRELPTFTLPWAALGKMVGVAAVAAVPAAGLWWLLSGVPLLVTGLAVIAAFAVLYLLGAHLAGLSELEAWTGKLLHRFKRRKA